MDSEEALNKEGMLPTFIRLHVSALRWSHKLSQMCETSCQEASSPTDWLQPFLSLSMM